MTINNVAMPCRAKYIYVPYLASNFQPFSFRGYEDVSQLGKYYALTIDDSLTRLYSVVNFLHPTNLAMFSKVTGRVF